jgi:hypothetical protein
MFYAETNLIKKLRGANNINAEISLLDKVSRKKIALMHENIQINRFKDTIVGKDFQFKKVLRAFLEHNV